ncbi:hypothetical protein PG996_003869 [Apiospora saccharicola]|uniref:Uncharacterized protein n=1 Tax=Apiospora saccharicola TaxID=335842 RepID=A0ABR1W2J1_9PEZI
MVSSGSSRKGGITRGSTGTSKASNNVSTTTATTMKLDNNSSSSKKLPWNDPNNIYKVDWDRFKAAHTKDRPMNHNQKIS